MGLLTQLSTINSMIGSLGMTALTANDSSHPTYIKALAKLTEIDVEFQNRGWWFNRTVVTLSQDVDGEVPYSSDMLHVDPTDRFLLYTMRNLRLYDLVNATFVIDADVEVNVVYQLPFDELPPLAQVYLKDRARHDFFLDEDGGQPKLDRYADLAQRAWIELRQEHFKNRDMNFFEGGHGLWFRQSFHPNNVNRVVARQ